METERVKVVGNGDVMGRPVPLNGCIKCVTTTDRNCADDDCRGNNNMTEAVTLINTDCKFDRSDCSKAADNGKRSQVQVCQKHNVDNDLCRQGDIIDECDKPVLTVSAEQSVSSAAVVTGSNKLALSVEGLNQDLSELAVSGTNTDISQVPSNKAVSEGPEGSVRYVVYESERQMEDIMRLITKDLSEPYSIYTYRYFIHNWPRLCYLAMDGDKCVGAIVCKLDKHRSSTKRGYIAMLAVDQDYRRGGIGSSLVVHAIKSMIDPANGGCDEVVLETEISNGAALRLYEKLGFVRDKRLFRYYLNGVDALRLKLWLK